MAASSRIKSKKNIVCDSKGVSWVVDDAGNKIKKVRKKIRRRSSVGNSKYDDMNSSGEFGHCDVRKPSSSSPEEDNDSLGNLPDGKMISFRTAATEKDSSHGSLSISDRGALSPEKDHSSSVNDNSGAFSTSSSKKSRKLKNIVEIDGQMWRTDDDGNPLNRVRKKKDRLSNSDHGRDLSSPSKGKKKKRSIARGSQSVRHFNHIDNIGCDDTSDSDDNGPQTVLTNSTSGTGSLTRPRPPQPRRSFSTPRLSLEKESGRPKMQRQRSGDLDMLMSQSVHNHTRQRPPSEKPTLGQKGGALGKTLEKSTKIGKKLGKIFKGGGNKDKEKNNTMRSLPEDRSSELKALPKGIREIDGVLWRVDQFGNKLNKVRKKSTSSRELHTAVSAVSDDEMLVSLKSSSNHNKSTSQKKINKSMNTWDLSSTGEMDDCRSSSSRDGFGGSGRNNDRSRRKQRKNSLDNTHTFSDSGRKMNDSDTSLYMDGTNETMTLSRRKARSRSIDMSKNSKATLESGATAEDGGDLLNRLRGSEKEISRLRKLTTDQNDTIDEAEKDARKIKKKLKQANLDKEDLADEIDRLCDELEKKDRLFLEERKKVQEAQQTANRNKPNDRGNSGSDRLVAQICELKQKKLILEKRMEEDQERFDSRLEGKVAEIEFLQEELDRMRSQQGDRQLQDQTIKSASDDEQNGLNGNRGAKPNFVGKILGNHLQGQAETQASLQAQEIRDLQDRVFQLQTSNDKLKEELRKSSLAIQEDDDEEVRRAKEAAVEAAAMAASCHKPQSMRMQRRGSAGGMIPQGLRMQRRGSAGGLGAGGMMPRRGSNPDQVWWGR